MLGHDLSSRRVPGRASFRLTFAAALFAAGLGPGTAHGQRRTDAGSAIVNAAPPSREPIDLAARRVLVWEQGGDQWILLSGKAAVLQGAEGQRADEAVVRVTAAPAPSGTIYHLAIYAETADARHPSARESARASFTTSAEVRLRPYDSQIATRGDGPPRDSALLARSGLAARSPLVPATRSARKLAARPRVASAPEAQVARMQSSDPTPIPRDPPVRPPQEPTVDVLPDLAPTPPETGATAAKIDRSVTRSQFVGTPLDGNDDPSGSLGEGVRPIVEPPELDSAPTVPTLPSRPGRRGSMTELVPLPDAGLGNAPAPARPGRPGAGAAAGAGRAAPPPPPSAPVIASTLRVTRIFPRNGTPMQVQRLPLAKGLDTVIFRGGVNIVTESEQFGIIDIVADNAIMWRKTDFKGRSRAAGPNGEEIEDARQPLELYLEGNVEVRQDERKVAGNGDQKTYRAKAAYFDVVTDRFIAVDAELQMFAPGLIAPARILAPRIEQFRPLEAGPGGRFTLGLSQIRADRTMTTGSRFPTPGYRFNSKSIDVFRIKTALTDPNSGKAAGDKNDPNGPEDLTWRIDARQNVFWLRSLPVFYWPRFAAAANDLEPPFRQVAFRSNNYLGQQLLTDWNGFRLIGVKKPNYVDMWNVDIDYLSARTKNFPALGSEIGWFGGDLINDLSDPYNRIRGEAPSWLKDYFGYFDLWGLRDFGRDTLGSGPAIITNNRAAGKAGFQRGGGGPKGAVPPFQDFRGRTVFRHMQRFLPDDDEHVYEDLRAQVEFGYLSDRYFLEEYYKRLFDVGMDQETLAYMIRQKQNWAYSIWTEANLQNWYTDTQWLPRFDYYRFGDSLLNNRLTHFQHSGVDNANVHTASEVNNPYIFAYMPFDPISNTSGSWSSGRGYTNHEVDLKLNLSDVFRVVPYVQGQAVGWSNQINGRQTGRLWGAAGIRAEAMAWRAYPSVQNEYFNVHGLNHKINVEADYRDAWANAKLNSIGVQDDLDDNTYESTRRYFALTNYAGGLLPQQYDPRHLILRRTISPISGPTDVQASLNSLHLGVHQRLQTKRGPEGKRRIIDWMTLDLDTTYFPNATRDNFGKPFGQNMYNWQWFIGDRTSITSYGWFEFWKLSGNPIYNTNINRHNDPFGLNIITSGISVSRPPQGSIFIGYSVVNTGPINTSALTTSVSYWMSPKWYGTYSTMYDFGNAILLSATFSLTRVGADYLSSVGLNVDPQRQSAMFAFVVSPRLSPNIKLGNGVGLGGFDTRYAPTQ